MDHWEAHFIVKREADAIVPSYLMADFRQANGAEDTADDLDWLGKLWLKDDDD